MLSFIVSILFLQTAYCLHHEPLEALQSVIPAMQRLQNLIPGITQALQNQPLSSPPLSSVLDGFENITWSLADMQCIEDLYKTAKGLTKLEMWALKMVDSGSKIPSGILEGNLVDLGQFDECVEVSTDDFVGQHCLVTVGIQAKASGIYSLLTSLTLSQCYPSTCSVSSINRILSTITAPLDHIVPGVNISFTVSETDCHTNNKAPLDTSDWIMVCICCAFGILAIISTTLDYCLIQGKEVTKTEALLRAFSLYTNGKKLFSTKASKGEMSAINGIKFFSMAWVIIGHMYGYTILLPTVNLAVVLDWVKDWTQMFIFNGTLSVDTFFVISGLLNAYGFFTLVERQRTYNIYHVLMSYLHRYIRLTPPFLIMVGMTATVLYRIGDGPIWDRVNLFTRQTCQKRWWYDVLYIMDYSKEGYCMDQSWYLGSDMQMFWLSPILLYPMWKWPKFGIFWFFFLFFGSISIPFALSYHYGIHTPMPLLPDPTNNPWASQIIYLPAHARLSTYIVGIMAGYLIYKIRKGNMRFEPSKIIVLIGWLVAGVFLLYPIYGGYWFYQMNRPYGQLADSFFIALFRPMFGIGVAWVIIACVTGYGGIVDSILSLSIFRPLGRLTYCSYLTHIAIINIGHGLIRTAEHLDDYRVAQEYIGVLVYSLATAAALSLLVEAPTMNLEKLLLGDLRPPTRNDVSDPRNNVSSPRNDEHID